VEAGRRNDRRGTQGRTCAEVAIIASARMTNEELYLVRCLARALGVEKLDEVPAPVAATTTFVRMTESHSNGVRSLGVRSPARSSRRFLTTSKAARSRRCSRLGRNISKLGLDAFAFEGDQVPRVLPLLANSTAEHSAVVLLPPAMPKNAAA